MISSLGRSFCHSFLTVFDNNYVLSIAEQLRSYECLLDAVYFATAASLRRGSARWVCFNSLVSWPWLPASFLYHHLDAKWWHNNSSFWHNCSLVMQWTVAPKRLYCDRKPDPAFGLASSLKCLLWFFSETTYIMRERRRQGDKEWEWESGRGERSMNLLLDFRETFHGQT